MGAAAVGAEAAAPDAKPSVVSGTVVEEAACGVVVADAPGAVAGAPGADAAPKAAGAPAAGAAPKAAGAPGAGLV